MTIISKPDEKRYAAIERAFSEHYESDWITELSHADAIDLLMRQWSAYRESNMGPLIWKHQLVVDVLTATADTICSRYAEENCESYNNDAEPF